VNGLGCIVFFLKHFNEFTKKRKGMGNLEDYHKNGIFEELCHLVEQKGDSSVHPEFYSILLNSYKLRNYLWEGHEILSNLDRDRNHYDVYRMVVKAYPTQWVERFWNYFICEVPDYNQMKGKVPREIIHARLIVDTLRAIIIQFVINSVPKKELLKKDNELLDKLIDTAKIDIDKHKMIIENEMGYGAVSLIDSLTEDMFKTPNIFFSVILDLWKSLHLI